MVIDRLTTRRLTFAILLAVGVAGLAAATAPASAPTPTGSRLRALAGDLLIGFASANSFGNLSDASRYMATAGAEFNVLTPENEMKFDVLRPKQNKYSFGKADKHVKFARKKKMKIHGHTLLWHSGLPTWMTNRTWTATELAAVMDDHITKVVKHFRGKVAIWDVVNEAFNDNGTRRASIWQNTIGSTYVEQAFVRARAVDPGAALVYNDYGIETLNAKSNAVYNMVVDFQSRGVPIDGVGFQMHLSTAGIDLASLASNMQRFADLGLKIYISEMDVRLPVPASTAALQTQAAIYRNVLDRCLLQPACAGFQMWGFTDRYSWIPRQYPGQGQALVFDVNYDPKPAYYALQARLAEAAAASPVPGTRGPALD